MKKKPLILTALFLTSITIAFSQDASTISTGDHLKSNQEIINSSADPATGSTGVNPASGALHTTVNANAGTQIPATTSGTMNSPVNPNTQLVIPLHKSKTKSNSGNTIGAGTLNSVNTTNLTDSSTNTSKKAR